MQVTEIIYSYSSKYWSSHAYKFCTEPNVKFYLQFFSISFFFLQKEVEI